MKPDVPVLKSDEWTVRTCSLRTAQDMVRKYHYSKGGSNTACYTHGLYRKDQSECAGVAWWLPPTKSCAINTFPEGDWRRVLSLSRLVLIPSVPHNGASFLMGKSISEIRKEGRFDCLVTYADTFREHTGAIYKATNWTYVGLTKPHDIWTDSEGRIVSRKAGPKTRTKVEMELLGYSLVGSFPKHKYRIVLRTSAPKRKSLLDFCYA